ncbi:MAG TPA: prepilin-type N-terminal cleavage/methylation domain-containing protein [Candidatus Binataceae bacterium]|nr:prepilin-type N-terminal cleavage/methylation domain-containing protein [Candidatus Binataceae bacterium]
MTLRKFKYAQRGFTLIELSLAIGLLALVMIMVYQTFAAVAGSKVHGENRLTADQEGRAIMWQLSKEIRGIVQTPLIPSKTLLIGQANKMGGTALDSITFSTLDVNHRRSLNGIGTEELVAYSAQNNPDHRGWFVLMRSQESALLTQTKMGLPPMAMADNVLGLHIRYFDGQRWQESWDSRSMPPGQTLPMAISLDLSLMAPGGRPVNFSTSVAIPMAFVLR